ncbi:TIGR01457 family HAD-type hydrolase [Carnobacteriaceae bacterium zg-ZUI252]|nr:TIGR01457 family HAD-type hydrolase [Carnobacteriaceae bacterium zg-ZUI252]MBS4770412.1 TIGR01457 family HAD-type hydrolase [Carnobacteriaceae bacterium zg-ZUI240]
MKQYKGYLIDLDGTIYKGNHSFPEAIAFIKTLQQQAIPFMFVTNNATKSPEMVVKHLEQFGLQVDCESVYTSALTAMDYLLEHHKGQQGLIIGESALKQLVYENGFHKNESVHADFVLQALDKSVTYEQLQTASLAIQNGAKYIVTNRDEQYPVENGFIPGSGAITALLVAATRTEPVVMGKPSHYILDGALKRLGLSKADVIMVGDNYHTDILVGVHNDVDTLLTLTGVTTREDVQALDETLKPTYVVNHLGEWHI